MPRLALLALGALALAFPVRAEPEVVPDPDDAGAEEQEAPEPAGPVRYRLDPGQSWLYVMVFNDPDRWTPVTGHDHGVRATTFEGTVVWDPSDAAACKVEIAFPVTALVIDPPGMRERAGLSAEGAIGDGAKNTATGNMLGKSQLDASRFPEIRYTSTSCSGTAGKVDVKGTLTVHGIAKEVSVPMTVTLAPERFAAKGSFTLGHADFDMKPFTYGPATPRNLEKLEFYVDVVGAPET